jgi:hypothetical protein
VLAVAATLALSASRAEADRGPRTVNKHIEDGFRKLIAEHAFERVTPKEWRLDGMEATEERVELTFSDAAGEKHVVALLVHQPDGVPIAGHGRSFLFHLVSGAAAAGDREALLRAAELLDATTTDDALAPETRGSPRSLMFPEVIPTQLSVRRPIALALGAAQALLLLAAILVGVAAPGRRQRP